MRWKFGKLSRAAVIGAALALAGCAASRADLNPPLPADALTAIKVGQTTEAQVMTLLGQPELIKGVDGQLLFHYYHYTLKHGTVLLFSRINIASDDIYIFFDKQGIVQNVIAGNRTQNVKFQFWPFGS